MFVITASHGLRIGTLDKVSVSIKSAIQCPHFESLVGDVQGDTSVLKGYKILWGFHKGVGLGRLDSTKDLCKDLIYISCVILAW